ncbi:hypothetical protein [Nonomuraea cypriaca]|uniref:hypothetical protein n=1 Tax=Nonomuraea cypriaca TaxID=1187855 RepID=UPI001F3E7FB5|nr:hypothetical protein [Nonomuraea cypriaca]
MAHLVYLGERPVRRLGAGSARSLGAAGAWCGARPGVPPPSEIGPQAARPDGGRDRAAIAIVLDEQDQVLLMWRHRFVFDR